jgi:hypothetical protein
MTATQPSTPDLPPACPGCRGPLVRSSNLLEDLGAIVLACRSCKFYSVEGDPDGRWFHRGNAPYGNALAALRACAEELAIGAARERTSGGMWWKRS